MFQTTNQPAEFSYGWLSVFPPFPRPESVQQPIDSLGGVDREEMAAANGNTLASNGKSLRMVRVKSELSFFSLE